MVKDREECILYTCATCNLQCRYCGIDKNPILQEIDKYLDESFKGDYYFNQIKKMFPNRAKLKWLQTWGGEPFLHMERIYPTIHKVIEYFPYFEGMFSSTNFSFDGWDNQFFGLMKQFDKYPERKFAYSLQLSCDGPEYINDYGRGNGTTKKCIANFDKLIEKVGDNLPPNVTLEMHLKPTLDNNSIQLLNTKEKIIEYYQFFEENFISKANDLGYSNVIMDPSIPNTAVPSPVTIEEGKIFAELIKNCKEIEKENETNHYFAYYHNITPYDNVPCDECLSYRSNQHMCGTGYTMIGILPNNKFSVCHEGFTYLLDDYKKLAAESALRKEKGTITFDNFLIEQKSRYCLTQEEYEAYEEQISYFNKEGTTARLVNIAAEIQTLALAGQIDRYFATEINALRGARFYQSHTAYCVKDNINQTGSLYLVPVGLLKLLFNGAYKYLGWEIYEQL